MTTSDDAADQLIQQLGDLCHEHYLGCAQNKSAPDGSEYSYDTEVICMLETPEAKQLITQHTEAAVRAAENALLAEMLTLIDDNMAYPELKGMVDVDALKSAVIARFGKGAA